MYPIVFGSYSPYFPLVVLIAAFGVYFVYRRLLIEGVSRVDFFKAESLLVISAWLGGKLFSLASRGWPEDIWHTGELTSGLRFSGVIIGLIIAIPLVHARYLRKVSLPRLGDVTVLAMVWAICGARIACFLVGCCTGGYGHSVLHAQYPRGSGVWYKQLQSGLIGPQDPVSQPVLMLPLLFMAASLVVALFMTWFDRRRQYNGQLLLIFLFLHELPKAGLELLRVPMIPEQVFATLILGAFGLLALMYFHRHPPKSRSDLGFGLAHKEVLP